MDVHRCKYCNKYIAPNSYRFCIYCGKRIDEEPGAGDYTKKIFRGQERFEAEQLQKRLKKETVEVFLGENQLTMF